MIKPLITMIAAIALAATQSSSANDLRHYVAPTISKGWQQVYASFPDPEQAPDMPAPDDIKGWKQAHDTMEKAALQAQGDVSKRYEVDIQEQELGNVPVVSINPKEPLDKHKVILYTHGGAYTMLSAHSTLKGAAVMATASALKVVSVDYEL